MLSETEGASLTAKYKKLPLSMRHEKKQMVLFEECYLSVVKQNYNEVKFDGVTIWQLL